MARSKWDWIFIGMFVIGVAGVALSMFQKACLKPADGATLFAGLLAGAIVWRQAYLIKQQIATAGNTRLAERVGFSRNAETAQVGFERHQRGRQG